MEKGLSAGAALEMGIVNKAFDPFERQLVADVISARVPQGLDRRKLFEA